MSLAPHFRDAEISLIGLIRAPDRKTAESDSPAADGMP